ncbi:MAG: recombinase RecT [Brachybacterium tyrofermentans]|uniref:recombinase RecT n=1 Tax=Brachybacterium tyrofermentans TaxID=47848 RepID=UPI001866F919|nr:recombinase RecT [Brachybacterium tyrofermentans]
MSEVIVHQPQHAMDLEQQMSYSKALAAASIIPKAYQNQPANILVAIGYAQALGEHPIAALTDVYVVEGRPSMSASMMHRRALEAGHRVRVTSTDSEAVVSIWRKDDPQHEHKIVWTLGRAKHAGLMGRKGPWQSYPAAMLRSRAVSEACRMACPEVLGPAKYTPDELGGDFIDAPEGAPAAFAAPGPTTKVSRKKKEPEPVDAEVVPENTDADTHGQDELREAIRGDGITEPQMKKLCALLTENGIDVQAYGPMSQIVGRDITSKTDLSKDEAARLIDSLETRLNQESN